MTTYAVGDIQGCADALWRLLDKLRFDPAQDRLWLVGDLVNRGPDSLAVLRRASSMGDCVVAVLGNHDLHLLAVAAGVGHQRRGDTLTDVLQAPDAHELLQWLRHRPLMHHDQALGWTMVHAGLAPQWDLSTAQRCAAEVEAQLRGKHPERIYKCMYADRSLAWSDDLAPPRRWQVILDYLMRVRFVHADGRCDLRHKGPPGSQPQTLAPWFCHPARRSRDLQLVFGHWSALGLYTQPGLLALDSGCLWGGALTAVALDAGQRTFQVACRAGALATGVKCPEKC